MARCFIAFSYALWDPGGSGAFFFGPVGCACQARGGPDCNLMSVTHTSIHTRQG